MTNTSPDTPTGSTRPRALVTGASSGIGLELAKQLAARNHDLVVAAEGDGLDTVAAGLMASGVDVRAVRVDLATREGVEQLYTAARATGGPLDVAAIHAGVGVAGDFGRETSLEDELRLLELNVVSVVHLAKLLLRDMTDRGSGRVLFTSSVASMMPGSYQAVYAASRAFVQSFAQAVRQELSDTGVTVTVMMPGPTDTNFFRRAGAEDTVMGAAPKDDPADVARQGVEALLAGRNKVVVGGMKTRMQAAAATVLPDAVKARMHAVQTKPRSGD